MAEKKRILITSALPYINGVKHLGNLAGSMLPADVYARFQRQRFGKDNVLLICATDEHGTPAELAAREENVPVADYCAKWHQIQKSLCEGFGLSFDHFGRSSSPENRELTQSFAQVLWETGYLEERETKQVYSIADKRFLPDRYVIGTCPHCGYDRARGDQCENCTRVLDPVDLIAPRSAISNSAKIEIRDSKHLFLRQSAFEPKLRAWIAENEKRWPLLVTSIALKWLDEGLRDRGITRDLFWGVPVNAEAWGPNPDGRKPDVAGLSGKVFYVWFDAPIEYIGATAEWAHATGRPDSAWQSWWRGAPADDVRYVEFMGKDNVPFHTVGFPCTLFGANERARDKWKLVDDLKGFNWLNYYGGKFSTSQKRGVFMDSALDILPADYWRYYLVANAPENADTSFTWEHFQSVVNKDLADVLGNFVNRILKFAATRYGGVVPGEGVPGTEEEALIAGLESQVRNFERQFESLELRKAVAELRAIWVAGNEYVSRVGPWTLIKSDPLRAAVGLRTAVNLIHLFAHLTYPIMPDAAGTMHNALMPPGDNFLAWPKVSLAEFMTFIEPGQRLSVPDVLFKKIEDTQIDDWRTRFGA